MPSVAVTRWFSSRAAALDEVEGAHRAVGGAGPGRRFATQQINHAYAILLSAQFQGFCRDLHTECINLLVRAMTAPPIRATIRAEFLLNRKIDRGNPSPGNIGADYNRLGIDFWPEVGGYHARNADRRATLEELNSWRNAIAHQDFVGVAIPSGRTGLHLADVVAWRRVCDGLVKSFDEVMRVYLRRTMGSSPW